MKQDTAAAGGTAQYFLLFLVLLFAVPRAEAGFVGAYSLVNWSLTNNNGDGSEMTPDNRQSIVLSGPNNGAGIGGSTTFTIAAVAAGSVQFDWSYSTLDPGFETAGYLLAQQLVLLSSNASDSRTGVSFAVTKGENFGFSISTFDNSGAPGILTISNFNVLGTAVPEPETLMLLPAGIAIFALRYRRRARYQ